MLTCFNLLTSPPDPDLRLGCEGEVLSEGEGEGEERLDATRLAACDSPPRRLQAQRLLELQAQVQMESFAQGHLQE